VGIARPLHDLDFFSSKPDKEPALLDGQQDRKDSGRNPLELLGCRIRYDQPVGREDRLDALGNQPISQRSNVFFRRTSASQQEFLPAQDGEAITGDQAGQVINMIGDLFLKRSVARQQCGRITAHHRDAPKRNVRSGAPWSA
jgi:hypothetical protein